MNVEKLQGMISTTLDSPISGGIKRIISTFINDDFLSSEDRPKCLELFQLIQEHVEVLAKGIHVFSRHYEDDRIITKLERD